MVLKVTKKSKSGSVVRYKGTKKILTPRDIKEADRFDDALNKEMREIEKVLLKRELLNPDARRTDMLEAWYVIGARINKFLENYAVSPEEKKLFWDQLYGRSTVINKTIPTSKISTTRNDFAIASRLARQSLKKLQTIGLWALWREILTYKAFGDERVLDWVVKKLERDVPETRNAARPFLKAVAARLKRIDTSVLSDDELRKKLKEIVVKSRSPKRNY